VLTANPCGLTGAVAGVTHQDEVPRRKPPYQLCQQQPGEVCWRPMPRAVHAIPLRGAVQGHQDGERPGPCGERPLEAHRDDYPLMAPALGRIAVGRPPAIAMPSLAKDLGARVLGDRLIAHQEHRPSRRVETGRQETPGRSLAPCVQPAACRPSTTSTSAAVTGRNVRPAFRGGWPVTLVRSLAPTVF
jgi:hypothetical protein